MIAALGACSRVGDHVLRLTASIGISIYPDDGEDAETLIDRADAAMYRAKKQPLGGFAFHATHPPGRASLPAPAMQSQRRRFTHYELTMAEHDAAEPTPARSQRATGAGRARCPGTSGRFRGSALHSALKEHHVVHRRGGEGQQVL